MWHFNERLLAVLWCLGIFAGVLGYLTEKPPRPDDACGEACAKIGLNMDSNSVDPDGLLVGCNCSKPDAQ